jgi:hypothetical protein
VHVAQTNLQLQRQLELAGWSSHDRQRVADAYELAVQLFTGQYRSSGKTFLAHLCGTASITETAGGTIDETLAALVHAAYMEGDFGDGHRGRTAPKQAEVRVVLGTPAETLVAHYTEWPWRIRLPEVRDGGPGVLDDWERPIAFLRLANEIEDHVDFANDYCPDHAAYVFPLTDVARCAQLLGLDELSRLAKELATEVTGHTVPMSLQFTTRGSAAVTPRSAGTRLWVRCLGDDSALRRSARTVPGARRVVYAWRRWRPTTRSE